MGPGPELDILAVTSCCGNQTIEKTTYNALRVCTLIGLDAPVGKGCPHPLLNDVMNAPSVHGESGLDGPALPEEGLDILHRSSTGKLQTLILRGREEDNLAWLEKLHPLFMDSVPLTLEEIFIYELGGVDDAVRKNVL